MYRSYFKISLRNLLRHKLHTFILIFGLAISMTACLLILEYVSFKLSFDRFHEDSDQIYRVINDRLQEGERVQIGTITYPVVGPLMKKDFPEVVNNTRLFYQGSSIVSHENERYRTRECLYVDDQFFQIFDFPWVVGNREGIFTQSNHLVLTRSLAKRVFQVSDNQLEQLIGQTLQIDNDAELYQIVGISEDLPDNTYFSAELFISYKSIINAFGERADNSYDWSDFYHYLKLAPGTDVPALNDKFQAFSDQYFRGEEVSGAEEKFFLQPMEEAHLYSQGYEYEIGRTNNGTSVWAMLLIALFILVIAWINYINLSSVRAIERSKEVGVRAVLGAKGKQLMGQFISEASMVNGISLLLAIFLAQRVQPYYNQLLGADLSLSSLLNVNEIQILLLLLIAVLFITGIVLSGAYPAWLLTGQNIPLVLKGVFNQTKGSRNLRRGLVIFQFAASMVLISGTWLVYQQVRLLNKADLGILTDQILNIDGPSLTRFDSTFIDRVQTLKSELMSHPGIGAATTSSRVPGERMGRNFNIRRLGQSEENGLAANFINVDHDYAETYGLELLAGEDFDFGDHSLEYASVNKLLINEAMVDLLNYESAEKAVGQKLDIYGKVWTIKGILPNFHQKSLHTAIEPIIFYPLYNSWAPISIKIANNDVSSVIQHSRGIYDRLFPGNAFEYSFLDETLQRAYLDDQRFGRILGFFAILAILIAALGLLGLASYTTYLRTKEISIRKVLGASINHIVYILSKDFIQLIVIALVIGTPFAWYLSKQWLSNFAVQIDIPWWVFLVSGLGAIVIAFLITSFQAIKATISNPIDALRNN